MNPQERSRQDWDALRLWHLRDHVRQGDWRDVPPYQPGKITEMIDRATPWILWGMLCVGLGYAWAYYVFH